MGVDSSSWTIMLNFLRKMLECNATARNADRMKAISEILEIVRFFDKAYRRNSSLSECLELAEIVVSVVSCLNSELLTLYYPHENNWSGANTGTRKPKYNNNLWEMQTIAFSMIGDALSRIGSSISENLWQSLVEVLRKVMDFVASRNLLIVDNVMSRFYTTLLHCLHLVLTHPKGSLSGQVTGFGATLQMFFTYGLSSRSSLIPVSADPKDKSLNSPNQKPLLDSRKGGSYVPPHLRRRERTNRHHSDAQSSSDCDRSQYVLSSSDSDLSDNDSYATNGDRFRSSKARVAAIVCVQDLCRAEPKSLTSLWTLLLPENDVLQPRKYQATLMTCLLFDPVMKIRLASASTLASMLDGHSSTFLQLAEYKGSTKCGSFTTLSTSLGQILMQLHTGIIYLIQQETHAELLTMLFKVLMLLISATPYARMPGNLLHTLIAPLCNRIREGLACNIEDNGLLETALSCLGAALSVSPPSSYVLKMLEEDMSRGLLHNQQESGIFAQLIQFLDEARHLTVRFEALQVLRAVFHNYPATVALVWENISAAVYRSLKLPSSYDSSYELHSGPWKGETGKTVGSTYEKCVMASVKALDECLRASSGFKGADDLLEFRLADSQLIADCTRPKKISSAPSYELGEASSGHLADYSSGREHWIEVIEKHLPLGLSHRSPMVRAAVVTCFAGMTSAVFFSLSQDEQDLVLSCTVNVALNDGVSSVRSAACRAIGVIACFSEILLRARVLKEFIHAVQYNSHDSSVAVRITACWALANICDSLRSQATDLRLERSEGDVCDAKSISLLFETALWLIKDGDKIKANAVRALGNLSRFIKFTCYSTSSNGLSGCLDSHDSAKGTEFSQINASKTSGPSTYKSTISKSTLCVESSWLERIIQAFVSCVTTGNVKVQWNVCHALSNLFMNDAIKLHNMPWTPSVYSILLLLLRDAANYKIRIHAAVALAVPASRLDYGNSFIDIVQGLVHVLESISSAQAISPSSFKYKDSLEQQVMLTTSHVLGLASSDDDQILKDFLIKKASFMQHSGPPSTSKTVPIENPNDGTMDNLPKNLILLKVSGAVKSLIDIYERSNNQNLARRLEKLASNFS
ncbi:uncharacterized protein A4U43_C08F2590 [Asparagus officinalis]|nr:uncharacterized protein A4U43_C08F2590 [Asparagus officinalis]